jgi:hypothetical protein
MDPSGLKGEILGTVTILLRQSRPRCHANRVESVSSLGFPIGTTITAVLASKSTTLQRPLKGIAKI